MAEPIRPEECFAYGWKECLILRVPVPQGCVKCKFRKREREVTCGRRYPYTGFLSGKYYPKYATEEEHGDNKTDS